MVLVSVWETRVQDYEVFAKETNREWDKPDFEQGPTHPAARVTWDDAQAFCAWLTERERKAGKLGANERYRLPSDHEWSCAVGIGEREDAATLPSEKNGKIDDAFPWGNAWPPPANSGNFWSEELPPESPLRKRQVDLTGNRDGAAATAPVGSYAANGLGLYDLAGNVSEFCEDWFDAARQKRATRGSSWHNGSRSTLRVSWRYFAPPDDRRDNVGFRCVLDLAAPR
jgi:formylglycine-generating enzyme required for sulfatase activity